MTSYAPGASATCPYCGFSVHLIGPKYRGARFYDFDYSPRALIDRDLNRSVVMATCPRVECSGLIVSVESGRSSELIWPKSELPPALDDSVPANVRNDFLEAHAVRHISTKACAAMARRCLQTLLHSRGFKKSNLAQEIDAALPTMSERLREYIHELRLVGNFSAHEKLDAAGVVVDVEPAEADWLLELLLVAFDFYFVTPARDAERKAALKAKLNK